MMLSIQRKQHAGVPAVIAAIIAVLLIVVGDAAGAAATELSPKEKAAQTMKDGIALFTKGDYEKAEPLFKEVAALNPGDKIAARYLELARQLSAEPLCGRAAESYFAGDYRKAVEQWDAVLQINPAGTFVLPILRTARELHEKTSNMTLLYQQAEKNIKQSKYDAAIHDLERILVLKPEDARAHALLATARQSVAALQIKGHYEKADALFKQGNVDLAVDEWKKVLALDKNQAVAARLIASGTRKKMEALYTQAKQLVDDGDYAAAREAYKGIASANPEDRDVPMIIERIAKVLTLTEKVDNKGQAWDLIRKSLANHIAPDGNATAAVVAVRYAEQLEPASTVIPRIRDHIEREHIAVVRTLEPPVPGTSVVDQYLFAGLNHIYDGRYDLAVQECNIVLDLDPSNVLALKRLGSAYFALGKKDKAQEVWKRALVMIPGDAELKRFVDLAR